MAVGLASKLDNVTPSPSIARETPASIDAVAGPRSICTMPNCAVALMVPLRSSEPPSESWVRLT